MREINKQELEDIYRHLMYQHFPAAEIKPWEKISLLWDQGKYHGYLWEKENQELIGYALLYEGDEEYWLLDYYAVNSQERNQGYGSRFLGELRSELAEKTAGVIIETENPDYGRDEAEKDLRHRRINFYLRNACEKSGILSTAEGVEYVILYMPGRKNCVRNEIAENLMQIYNQVLPKDAEIAVWAE